MTRYLLDSSVFIQAKNLHYRFVFCQAFWDLLIELNRQGKVFSINKVKRELRKGSDELTEWIENLPDSFWLNENNAITEYANVINWSNNQNFKPKAVKDFAEESRADAWLVSTAKYMSDTVIVTQEVHIDTNIKKAIKIPNAADAFEVDCISIYDFLSATCENNFTAK